MKGGALFVAAVLTVLSVSGDAAAYHSDRKRNVAGTAYMLQQREWQVGLFRVDYGALDKLQPGTYLVPWIFLFPNVQLKMMVFQNARWTVSIRPGFFYADLSLPRKLYGLGSEDTDIKLWVIPLEGYVSLAIRQRFTLTMAGVYTGVAGKGSYNPDDYEGTAAAANAQVGLGLIWRINQISALNFQARYVAFQSATGVGSVTVRVDGVTTADVEARGTANAADASNGFSFSAYAHFSFRYLNLKIGVGYGNYNIPGMNLVIPKRYPFPVFDLYWRF